jgi:hypothetical protein
MFKRGISDEFERALLASKQWGIIVADKDLYFAMRNEYVNVYYEGCSIFKISFERQQLRFETHYKYLVHPHMKKPYIMWRETGNRIKDRMDKIFIETLDTKLLKKAASYYAGAEKTGVHKLLQCNNNIIDVEIAFSSATENEQDIEDELDASRPHADRIDFAALRVIEAKSRIVFFEAKHFDNSALRSGSEIAPPVIEQIERYEKLIEGKEEKIKDSYRRVCKNLHTLAPDRWHDVVKQVVGNKVELTVDPKVRLVVFGFDADGKHGKIWKEHKDRLTVSGV